jgi:serine/threonine-protein kinase
MSPEQATSSKAADIRSDIYSLGCTWYHMLTGRAPYPSGSVTNKLTAHVSSPIPDPRDINPQIPESLVAVLHRMMAKKQEDRYQSPAELLGDLNDPTLFQTADPAKLLAILDEDDVDESTAATSSRVNAASSANQRSSPKSKKRTGHTPKQGIARPPAAKRQPRERRQLPIRTAAISKRRAPRPMSDVRNLIVFIGIAVILLIGLLWAFLAALSPSDQPPPVSPYSIGMNDLADRNCRNIFPGGKTRNIQNS